MNLKAKEILVISTQPKLNAELRFLSINDLVNNQGELTLMLEFDSSNQHMCIEACAQLPADATQQNIAATYISLCSDDLPAFSALYLIPVVVCLHTMISQA